MFPYVADMNFEAGGVTEFDSEVDTQGKLNVRHWSWLAGHGARLELPYQGAYAMHIDLSGGTAAAYLQEDNLFDLAADATLHIGFWFYAKDLTMATSDRFNIFALESVADTNEVAVGVINNAGEIQLICAETGATAIGAGSRQTSLAQGVWHHIGLSVNIDAGGGNDGTIDFFVDGYQVGTQITALDQGAIVHARLGVTGIDAGTTTGHLLFDSLVADDTRVYPVRQRFSEQQMAFKSGHLFLGRGELEQVTLMAGAAADNALILYDTDEANTNDPSNIIVPELRNAQGASDTVVYKVPRGQGWFERGCYAVLSGTNPRALVMARRATQGIPALRSFAPSRQPHRVV